VHSGFAIRSEKKKLLVCEKNVAAFLCCGKVL